MGRLWIRRHDRVTVTVPGHVPNGSRDLQGFRSARRRSASVSDRGTVPEHVPGGHVSEGLGVSGMEVLFEAPGLPAFELPEELAAVYGGSLGFEEPRVFANFVSTLDGVVAIPSLPSSNKVIAGGSSADRFVLGLLRACCDVLVIGSGTMAASPRSVWTAEQGYPPAAAAFAELRHRLRKPPEPEVAVITGSGVIDPDHPAFAAGAIVFTTDDGAARLAGRLPDSAIVALGETVRSRPRRRGAARARPPADPVRGRPARDRSVSEGRSRRRALPHDLAASRRPNRATKTGSRSSKAPTCSPAARSERG